MTETLAEVLADVEDREIIERLLEIARAEEGQAESPTNHVDTQTLRELYDRYLERRHNRSPGTRTQYQRTIPTFIDFAEENSVVKPVDISTELVDRYVDTLQEKYDRDATILTYTKNVRSWLQWLNKRSQCSEDICRILNKDELGLNPRARDEALSTSNASTILEKLRQQRRGSLMHALLELLWNAGLRIGGAHSLDVGDFDPTNNEVQLRHRPESGTHLKNGSEDVDTAGDGERNVELKSTVVTAIEGYLTLDRPDVTDNYGREPLFTTQQGRAVRSTLRRKVYQATSCRWAPKDSGDQDCDGSCDPDSDVCQYSFYPHAIRRGAIVHHLSGGLHPSIASERFDVSIQTLRKHYDPRTKRKRKEDRSDAVRSAWSG